jgi:hypothetical protein
MHNNRTAVQKVLTYKLSALMQDFMFGIFPKENKKSLQKLESYLLGEFIQDVFETCLQSVDYDLTPSSMGEFIAYGDYSSGDWYTPPEQEEMYINGPVEYNVKMELQFSSKCILKLLLNSKALKNPVDPTSREFAKLISDSITYGFKDQAPDILESMDTLLEDLESDWKSEVFEDVSGIFSSRFSKLRKGKLIRSGGDLKVLLDFTVDVEMEELEFIPEEQDPDDYRDMYDD